MNLYYNTKILISYYRFVIWRIVISLLNSPLFIMIAFLLMTLKVKNLGGSNSNLSGNCFSLFYDTLKAILDL